MPQGQEICLKNSFPSCNKSHVINLCLKLSQRERSGTNDDLMLLFGDSDGNKAC